MADEDDYEVGYGRPPRATRFPKGVSGNPNGRPQGSHNLDTIVHKVCKRILPVKVNGEVRRVTTLEAMVMQLANQALEGNLKALAMLFQLSRAADQGEENFDSLTPDLEKDQMAMQGLFARAQSVINQSAMPDPQRKARDEEETKQ